MLRITNEEHFKTVTAFADKVGLRKQLDEKLKWLDDYRGGQSLCILRPDFAPYSFEFSLQVRGKDDQYSTLFVGGLLYHGPHDGHGSGSFPTLAVTVEATTGWSIHT